MAKKKKKKAVAKPAKKKAKAKPVKKKTAEKKSKPAKKAAKKKVVAKKKTPAKKAVKKKTPAKAKAKVKTAPAKVKPAKKVTKKVEKAAAAKAPPKPVKSKPAKEDPKAKPAAGEGKKTSQVAKPAAPALAPIKVEPKIIETPEPKSTVREDFGDLFSEDELETFRKVLEDEKEKILDKARKAVSEGSIRFDRDEMMDEVDQASAMEAQNLNLRLLDRDRKLLSEIQHAIGKIDSGDYGYCEGTGEPIPKRRLELRPWTRHSVKFKERLERMKKSGRGVADEDEV